MAQRRQFKTWFARQHASRAADVGAPAGDRSARLRVLTAFGRLSDETLQRLLGDVSKRQISRLKAGQAMPSTEQLELVARATGAPLWFVHYGFDPPAEAIDRPMVERVESLERQVEELQKKLAPTEEDPPPLGY